MYGTFGWRKLQFLVSIPLDITGTADLSLGLQDSSGTVCFDSVKVTIFKGLVSRPTPPVNPPPAFKGHDLPRRRGVMSPDFFRDEDIRVLGTEWKANLIRWQITRNWGRSGTDRDLADFDRWFERRLAELDQVLASCHKYGVKVVVDMHSPPGGRYPNHDLAIFNEPQYQNHFVTLWEKVARRYKGNPAIWGYDLINEPVQNAPSPPGVADYLGTQLKAAKAIRAIDSKTPIFIAAADWDSAEGYRELEPVNISNVIYQVHMYAPGEFTHQGVYLADPSKAPSIAYQLRRMLQPVRDFQLAYNVHIYVGEFGVVRWAPGAANYLRDCIELFEEYGWDWSYFAFREGDAWSLEHGSDPSNHQPVQEPSDRQQLLRG